jgi:hypothetical protein
MNACAACGRQRPLHRHHVTGRGRDGDYLDPGLLVGLCWPCHHDVHDILRTIGCDNPGSIEPGVTGRMTTRLVRLGVLLAVMATSDDVVDLRPCLDYLSQTIEAWWREADLLGTAVGRAS